MFKLLILLRFYPKIRYYGAGDWELCHTSLSNFTAAAEDMVECKEVNIMMLMMMVMMVVVEWKEVNNMYMWFTNCYKLS